MVIEINKDIDRYQESVAMGLTAKQLVFSIASVIVGGGIVLLLYRYIGLTGSAYVAIPCVAPIALGGFYSFNGMNFYEYMGKKLHFMFGNKALTYVSTEGEPIIKAFEMEQNGQVKKKGKKTQSEITTSESAVKKQEEFEEMKKKTRNIKLIIDNTKWHILNTKSRRRDAISAEPTTRLPFRRWLPARTAAHRYSTTGYAPNAASIAASWLSRRKRRNNLRRRVPFGFSAERA